VSHPIPGFYVHEANGSVVRRQRKLKLHLQTAWSVHSVTALLVADVRNPTAFEVFRCRGGVELGKLQLLDCAAALFAVS
jgi:hypothetical protein